MMYTSTSGALRMICSVREGLLQKCWRLAPLRPTTILVVPEMWAYSAIWAGMSLPMTVAMAAPLCSARRMLLWSRALSASDMASYPEGFT